MENSNELAKRDQLGDQSFIERLVSKAESLEQVKAVGMVIIDSGFCPDHFKQSKDAVGVIMCIEAGKKLGITWMQALSDIYPVKGRIGMMGTLAKSLIFSSGLCEKWEEITEGTYPNPEYKHIIISKRKGYPNENRSEFSVYDAATAGLMQKPIYKSYGKRMLMWRNVGNHANDFWTDIMKGMKTVEELNDYDPALLGAAGATTVITQDGKKLNIDEGKAAKSETISQSVTAKIDKENGSHKQTIQDAEVVIDPEPEIAWWDGTYLADMKAGIYDFAKQILPEAKYRLLEVVPQRKSNALYREALLTFHNGGLPELDKWLTKALGTKNNDSDVQQGNNTTSEEIVPPVTENAEKKDDLDMLNTKPGAMSTTEATKSFEAQRSVSQPAGAQKGSMFPNQEGAEDFKIPSIDQITGERSFPDVYKLRSHLIKLGMKDSDVEGGLEKFCKKASNEMVQEEINVAIQKSM